MGQSIHSFSSFSVTPPASSKTAKLIGVALFLAAICVFGAGVITVAMSAWYFIDVVFQVETLSLKTVFLGAGIGALVSPILLVSALLWYSPSD